MFRNLMLWPLWIKWHITILNSWFLTFWFSFLTFLMLRMTWKSLKLDLWATLDYRTVNSQILLKQLNTIRTSSQLYVLCSWRCTLKKNIQTIFKNRIAARNNFVFFDLEFEVWICLLFWELIASNKNLEFRN